MVLVTQKLTDGDRETLARKNALREQDRRAVEGGECTWADMNRANSLGASVIHLYRPLEKPGQR
jgi:hypothetical protein